MDEHRSELAAFAWGAGVGLVVISPVVVLMLLAIFPEALVVFAVAVGAWSISRIVKATNRSHNPRFSRRPKGDP